MKKQTDELDDKKKVAEKAIERWENEGGEVLTTALEKQRNIGNENRCLDEISNSSSEQKILRKVRQSG